MARYKVNEKQTPFPHGIKTNCFHFLINLSKDKSIESVEVRVGGKGKIFPIKGKGFLKAYRDSLKSIPEKLDFVKISSKIKAQK